jgi:NADPH2:quinone reductase
MARAVRITEFGGPNVLNIVDIDMPVAAAGEIVIEVRAIGVNPVETKIRNGSRGGSLDEPMGIGSDAAGVVVAVGGASSVGAGAGNFEVGADVGAVGGVVGAGAGNFEVGDRVMGFGLTGAYATHVAAPVGHFRKLPDNVTFAEGAALGVPVGTAYQLLKSLEVNVGETLLVHSGSGGVGQAAIQFAKLWGATVIATASAANHGRLTELGALPVTYGEGLLERVRAAAPQGVDVVLESAGTKEALDASLALVADRTRIGEIVQPTWGTEFGVTVFSGGLPGSVGPAERALRVEAMDVSLRLIAQGKFSIEIAGEYPLDRVREAAEHSATTHVRGKIILVP